MGVPVDTRLLRAHETVSACAVNETGQPKDLGDGINHHIPFGSTATRGGPHPPPQRTLASRCGTGRAGFGLSLEDARPRAPPAGAVLSRGSSHRRPSAYAFGPPCCPPGEGVHCYHLTPHEEVRRGGTEFTRVAPSSCLVVVVPARKNPFGPLRDTVCSIPFIHFSIAPRREH